MGRINPDDYRQDTVQPDVDMGTLDETWPLLWTDDLFNIDSNNSEDNTLNMYLLGIPQLGTVGGGAELSIFLQS